MRANISKLLPDLTKHEIGLQIFNYFLTYYSINLLEQEFYI